jgi:hypothetical protein
MLVHHALPLALAAGLVAVGCQPEPSTGGVGRPVDAAVPDASGGDGPLGCAEPGDRVAVDLLFVVGNGPRSLDAQEALAEGAAELFERLDCNLGVRPDLHVGVVSTDLGAGGFDIPLCDGAGDAGALQSSPRVAGCAGPTDAYLEDIADGSSRDTNYAGSIGEAFECIARLGSTGCAFEQPIAAALAATDPSNPANAGFVREDALLAVIFVGGADDCSADDPQLFDPEAVAALGPLSPFRCFEHGVICAPDEPRSPGVKVGCVPREGGGIVADVSALASALAARKPDRLFVAVAGGIEAVVVKAAGGGQVSLESSCAPSAVADPPIRLDALAEELDGTALSHCSGAPNTFAAIGAAIAVAAEAP